MPYVGKKPADIIATAIDTTTGTFSGVVDADAGITVDNITIDGTEIDLSSGDLTLDVAGDIILDADGKQIIFADGGTQFGQISTNSTPADMAIKSLISDEDIIFQGIDNGSSITALTLDMSEGGRALFTDDVLLTTDNKSVKVGAGNDLSLTSDGTNGTIATANGDLTLDVAGDINIDAGGAEIKLLDDGTEFGRIFQVSSDFYIKSIVSDKDIIFQGNDGGSAFTALTLDMSAAGEAKFNDNIVMGTAGKGIHLGVTSATASNLLDDYEEGTFNISSAGNGYAISAQGGKYTKIGDTVHCNFTLTFSSVNSGATSNVTVSSLPFTCGSFQSNGTIRESSNTGVIYVINVPASGNDFSISSMDGVGNNNQRTIRVNENYVGSFTYKV